MKFHNLIFIIIFSFNCFAQKSSEQIRGEIKTLKGKQNYSIKYLKDKNVTKVGCQFIFLNTSFLMKADFEFDGTQVSESIPTYNVWIAAIMGNRQIGEDARIAIIADGTKVFDDTGELIEADPVTESKYYKYKVPADILSKIANASKVMIQLRSREMKVDRENIEMLSNVYKLGVVKI